jgi:NADH-quinone oxidoreductase subunit M
MNAWVAAAAALTQVIGAAYTLWLVKRVIFGAVTNDHVAHLKDINVREALVLGAFAAGVLLVGVWPAPLTHLMDASVRHVVDQLLTSKL